MSYETADILDAAADKIERDGWHQGDFAPPGTYDGDTLDGRPSCVLGAIHASTAGMVWKARVGFWDEVAYLPGRPALVALRDHLNVEVVPFWNDAEGRTQQEVLEALRGAAKAERRAADGITS